LPALNGVISAVNEPLNMVFLRSLLAVLRPEPGSPPDTAKLLGPAFVSHISPLPESLQVSLLEGQHVASISQADIAGRG
jgi:hypothetical protein